MHKHFLHAVLSLALIALTAPAFAQQPAPSSQAVDEITVLGNRKDLPRVIRDYVTTFTARSPRDRVARWDVPICPGVIGAQKPLALSVIDRLRETAQKIGVPVDPKEPCQPNLVIVFSSEPQKLMTDIGKKYPDVLGYHYVTQVKELTKFTHPVQALYNTATRYRDGVPYTDSTDGKCDDGTNSCNIVGTTASHIQDDISSVFQVVTVVVDTSKIMGMDTVAVTDYATMLALSQTKSFDGCSALPSIRNLFAKGCDPAWRTTALSASDFAYLDALYSMPSGMIGPAERTDLQSRMLHTLKP